MRTPRRHVRRVLIGVLPFVMVVAAAPGAAATNARDLQDLVTACAAGSDPACGQAQTVVLGLVSQLSGCARGTGTAVGVAVTIVDSPYIGPSTALGCTTRTATLLQIVDDSLPILLCVAPPETRSTCAALDNVTTEAVAVLEACSFGAARSAGVNLNPLGDSLGCEVLADYVIAESAAMTLLGQTCVSGQSPACAAVLAATGDAILATEGCVTGAAAAAGVGVTGPPDPGCGSAAMTARALAEVGSAAAQACLNGTDTVCGPLVAEGTSGVEQIAAEIDRCITGDNAACVAARTAVDEVTALVTQCISSAFSCVSTPSAAQLPDVAKAAIEAKNEYLVSGSVDTAPVEYQAWLASSQPELDERRAGLAAVDIGYTSQTTIVTNSAVSVDGATATVVADVESRFGMVGTNGNTGVPAVTAGGEQMHFVFSAMNGRWVLDHVDTDDIGGLYYQPDSSPTDTTGATHAPALVPVADADSPVVVDVDTPTAPLLALATPPPDDSNRHHANRSQVIAYAINHSGVNGHSYNSAFYKFRSDCTNFVSQSLEVGGWAMTPRGYDPTKAWWYETSQDFVSSWTTAEHFYWFVDDNGWAPKRTTLSAFRPGDIMQVKLPKYHPERIGHSMVVTARDSKGSLYLTYHTGDWENTPYVDFVARSRGAKGQGPVIYGWNVG